MSTPLVIFNFFSKPLLYEVCSVFVTVRTSICRIRS